MKNYDRFMVKVCLCLVCVCFPLGSLLSQAPSDAAEDTLRSYQIDEVISSGTRTPTKVIDIPYSVQRINNYDYKYEKKVGIDAVLGGTPGLFMQSRYGNHDVRISIRGFGSRSNTGIRGVRILQDGIAESEPDGQTRIESIDFHNIGSIEVVKGNASSLYTNAPGGVINFMSDLSFPRTFGLLFAETGSFEMSNLGLKAGVKTDHYRFLMTYNLHKAVGYRIHSSDTMHIFNTAIEIKPTEQTQLSMFAYYVDGTIRLPGSLTRTQFDADPLQPNARDLSRDAKRISKKGRLGVRFNAALDESRTNEVELTAYGTMKYFERTARTYRIFNRNGIGSSGRFVNRSKIFGEKNEFSIGGDLLYQSGPIEDYNNLNGTRGDILGALTDETITNAGFYVQNSFDLVADKMKLFLTGRYDNVGFITNNQLLAVQNSKRTFGKFTPKAALNYKLTPTIAAYTSYGLGFDTPAGNELDNYPLSTNHTLLLNPDLQPQTSKNFELGIKGAYAADDLEYFQKVFFEATFFNITIDDEVVPFEVFGDVFFRNAARSKRAGVEFGVDAELLYGLRLKTAYTFSDFKYDEYFARSFVADTVLDARFAGNVVPSVPKHNLSLALSYTRVLHENITGFVKTQFLNISGMYVDDMNSEKTEGYQLLNASLGVDLVFDRFNVLISAGANNIADKRYIGFVNINSTSKEFYEAGEPRNYYAGINLGLSL